MRNFLLLVVFVTSNLFSQSIVFSDNFDGVNFIGANGEHYNLWNIFNTGADWGVIIQNNEMQITNNLNRVSNIAGNEIIYFNNNNIAFYNNTLNENSSTISWSFNIQQSFSPSGFDGTFASAFIIASNSFNVMDTTTKGYALIFGRSSTDNDPVQLVQFSKGLKNTNNYTSIITCSNIFNDVNANEYMKVKVSYDPLNNKWDVWGNKSNSFLSVNQLSFINVGELNNIAYFNESLPYTGFVMHFTISTNQYVKVDNFNIALTIPTIVTINFPAAASNVLNWTLPSNYDPAKMETIVFLKEGSEITDGVPTNNISNYSASLNFGSGTPYQFDPAAYCIYKGDNSTIEIENLKSDVEYYAVAYITDGTNIYSAPTKSHGILPVELTSFIANVKSNGVELNWITAT